MPKIIDSIALALRDQLHTAFRNVRSADFCIGYFNLRGCSQISSEIDALLGRDGVACRILIGMSQSPQAEMRERQRLIQHDEAIDNQSATQLKKLLVEEFCEQSMIGAPTIADGKELRHLARHQLIPALA